MSSYLPDYFAEPLRDSMHAGSTGVLDSRHAEGGVEEASIVSYDHRYHTAQVRFSRVGGAGGTDPVNVRCPVRYKGKPGAGSIHSYEVDDVVTVKSQSQSGLYNQMWIDDSFFTPKDHGVPMLASWHAKGKGVADVFPNKKGDPGFARHTDNNSDVAETRVGGFALDDWGYESVQVTGLNTTYAQKRTNEFAGGLADAAAMV